MAEVCSLNVLFKIDDVRRTTKWCDKCFRHSRKGLRAGAGSASQPRRARQPVSRVLYPPPAGDGHSSGTPVTGRLVRPTRAAAAETRPRRRSRDPGAAPTWSCSRWGLPCRRRCRRRGALLPHPFTLARWPKRAGGLLSVALSLGSPPPGVTRHRVPVEPGLSSPRRSAERPSGHLAPLLGGIGGGCGQEPVRSASSLSASSSQRASAAASAGRAAARPVPASAKAAASRA